MYISPHSAACTETHQRTLCLLRRFTIKLDTEPHCNLVKQLWRDGHEIALHTRDHVRLDPPMNDEKEGECSAALKLASLCCRMSGMHWSLH